MKRISLSLAVAAVVAGIATPAAAEVVVQTFASGTPARAADVNQNFTNVKNAVELAERRLAALQERVQDLEASLEKLMTLSDAMSIQPINGVQTVTLSGVNFQVINGRGLTESINGAGNIIIGYDEANRLTDQSYCSHRSQRGGHVVRRWNGLHRGRWRIRPGPQVWLAQSDRGLAE